MSTPRTARNLLVAGSLALAALAASLPMYGADASPAAESSPAAVDTGLVTVPSANSVADTASMLQTSLESNGLTVFGVVDHAANAAAAGLELLPTTLVMAGNPNLGTPLMQSSRSFAIDLPQKFLIWEDENGDVFITYNDPQALAVRHGVTDQDEVIGRISGALANFSAGAGAAPGADG